MAGWFMAGSHPAQYAHDIVTEPESGRRMARIRYAAPGEPSGFGTLMQMFQSGDRRGRRMRFSAEVRTTDVLGWLGLWMRVDGANQRSLAFDNMQNRSVTGTTGWHRHDVVLDVPDRAAAIAFGVLLAGRGEGCISGVRFEEVGADVPTTGGPSKSLPTGPENLDLGAG
jgi:hypothetical protein